MGELIQPYLLGDDFEYNVLGVACLEDEGVALFSEADEAGLLDLEEELDAIELDGVGEIVLHIEGDENGLADKGDSCVSLEDGLAYSVCGLHVLHTEGELPLLWRD